MLNLSIKQSFNKIILQHRHLSTTSSTMKQLVKTLKKDGIFYISINRPERRNCVNHQTALKLIEAFNEFDDDTSLKIAIIHGEGGNFCAGYDLEEVSKGEFSTNEDSANFLKNYRFMGPTMMKFKKPVIGAIEGYAVAGGLEISLMCDLRVASKESKFGVLCRRFGVPLLDGGTIRLPALIGLSKAMDMILTGRLIDANTAYNWGLVNRLTDKDKTLEEATKLAQEIMKHPQRCMLADRQSTYHSVYDSTSYTDAFEFELNNGIPVLDEAIKGAGRFISKEYKNKL